MLALNNYAVQVTNQNGVPTVVVPGSTLGGEGLTGALHYLGINPIGSVPIGLTGTVDVSSTVNPFASPGGDVGGSVKTLLKPSFGPVAGLPLKAIQSVFSARAPGVSHAASLALGDVASSQPMWTQGVPNSLLQHAGEGTLSWLSGQISGQPADLSAAYTSALLSVMADEAVKGQLPDANALRGSGYPSTAAAKAGFIRKANNLVAMAWVFRSLASFASPVSISLGQADLKISNEVQAYINKAGGDLNKGFNNFTRDHPDWVPFEVFHSTASNGYSYPETQQGRGLDHRPTRHTVDDVQSAGALLLPNTDTKGAFRPRLQHGTGHGAAPQVHAV